MLKDFFKKKNKKVSNCAITETDFEKLRAHKEKGTQSIEQSKLKPTEPRFAAFNHKAHVVYMNGTEAVYWYYYAKGKNGKIILIASTEDGEDIKTAVLDMKNEVKQLILS